MTASSYDAALARLLVHEGGYTNDAADPGGPTNFGITIFDYRKYVKPDATAADVKGMKLDEAKNIYRSKYWAAQRCDELPAGVDYAVFDYGVNSGIGRSGKVLRRCLQLADNTSVVNDAVLAAARAADAKALIAAICNERLRFLQRLRTWSVFGKGWGARVAEVKAYALQLAAGATAAMPAPSSSAGGKGVVPVAKGAQQGSAGAIAAAGAAAAQQAHQSGAPHMTVTIIIAAAAVAAIGAWLFWCWRQNQLQHAATPGPVPVAVAA
jgi:lysozyme family protein